MKSFGWILKSEPSEYSIHNLAQQVIGRWDGVRNYQARNFLREMKVGEKLFFYHSNCAEPGIYGSMIVHREQYPDPTAVDKNSKYHDPKATEDRNPWTSIDVKIDQIFSHPLLLSEIKELPLGKCRLTAKGNRLSVIPLTADQFRILEEVIRKRNQVNGETVVMSEVSEDITKQDTQPLIRSESGSSGGLRREMKRKAEAEDHSAEKEAVQQKARRRKSEK